MELLWTSLMRVIPSFLLLWCINSSALEPAATNNTDQLALLSFKSQVTQDPFRVMVSWNDSLHFCDWQGVTCGRPHQRVVKLNLQFQGLVGSIPAFLGNLTFLRFIYLQDNLLQGEIPEEIGRLNRLQYLNLTNNSLVGEIPTSLANCSELRVISLQSNHLFGKIPILLGSLSKLVHLSVFSNNLAGAIPPSLGNLSHLQQLSLGRNIFEGSIPDSLHALTSLEVFRVGENQVSGMVPPWLFNLSSLTYISVPLNRLLGSLPPDIGTGLPNLYTLAIGDNQLTGPIPNSLSNSSALQRLDMNNNNFIGSVNINFGGLQHLWWLNLGGNHLGQGEADDLSFVNSLTNCSNLQKFALYDNNFGGMLPNSVANLSTELDSFLVGQNQIVGSIPRGIENLINLTRLGLEFNSFTGSIPDGVVKLHKLNVLSLKGNRLSGQIPSSLGNLTQLFKLHLYGNILTGSIPWSLENCRKLEILDLSQNNLNGVIPKQVISSLSFLTYLNLANNSLNGSVPLEVGSLKYLQQLDISENKLSGEIPSSLGDCSSLEQLHMEGNFFHGSIPSSMGFLVAIQYLDLSRNNLSGKIPSELDNLYGLQNLNLSLNDLEGEVPSKGVFKNATEIAISGNNKLCGGIPDLQLPVCPIRKSKKHGKPHTFKVIVTITGVVLNVFLITCCIIILYWRRKSREKPSSTFPILDGQVRVSYGELLKATDGFSEANLIGIGSFGSVYKGVLHQHQKVIAVKVLNLQQRGASKSFMSECKALRRIRHRNLLKIFSACSSVDYQGNEFKAIVFEFMPNGSLESWLHPSVDEQQHELRSLALVQRLNVAINVASALDYLHHGSQTTIVHSDLKPSNILLDDDMIAHVGDFGLAKVLSISSDSSGGIQTNSIALKGSFGYVAPEYGMGGEVSIQGDVYSYGILLLEMFTGKRPTNDMFKDGLSIHNFTKMALPEQITEIVDPHLLLEDENDESSNNVEDQIDRRRRLWECLISVIRIGVICSMESPRDRMGMSDVVVELCLIRDIYQGLGIRSQRQS